MKKAVCVILCLLLAASLAGAGLLYAQTRRLQDENARLDAQAAERDTRIETLTAEAQASADSLAALSEQATEKDSELASLRAAVQEKEKSLDQLTDELTQAKAQLAACNTQLTQLRQEVDEHQAASASAQTALDEALANNAQLQQKNSDQAFSLTDANARVESETAARQAAEAERDALQKKFDEQTTAHQAELEALNVRLQQKEEELSAAAAQHTAAVQAISDAEQIFSAFAEKVDGWRENSGNNPILNGLLAPFTTFVQQMRDALAR